MRVHSALRQNPDEHARVVSLSTPPLMSRSKVSLRRTSKPEPVQWSGPLGLKVAMILSPTLSSPNGSFAQTLVAQNLWPQRATRARRRPSDRAHRPSIVTAMLTVEELKSAPAAKMANLKLGRMRCLIAISGRAAPAAARLAPGGRDPAGAFTISVDALKNRTWTALHHSRADGFASLSRKHGRGMIAGRQFEGKRNRAHPAFGGDDPNYLCFGQCRQRDRPARLGAKLPG